MYSSTIFLSLFAFMIMTSFPQNYQAKDLCMFLKRVKFFIPITQTASGKLNDSSVKTE